MLPVLLPALLVVLASVRAQVNPGNQFFGGPLAPAPLTPQGQPPPDVSQRTGREEAGRVREGQGAHWQGGSRRDREEAGKDGKEAGKGIAGTGSTHPTGKSTARLTERNQSAEYKQLVS